MMEFTNEQATKILLALIRNSVLIVALALFFEIPLSKIVCVWVAYTAISMIRLIIKEHETIAELRRGVWNEIKRAFWRGYYMEDDV